MPLKQQKTNFKLLPVILLPLILFSYTLKSWFHLQDRLNIIKSAQDKVIQEKEKKDSLERELARVQATNFIEKQARDKLNLGKEIAVILPTLSLSPEATPTPPDTSANWQKWVRLFL